MWFFYATGSLALFEQVYFLLILASTKQWAECIWQKRITQRYKRAEWGCDFLWHGSSWCSDLSI